MMAKKKQGKWGVQSYTIRGTNMVVRAGDCVMMRSPNNDNAPYVARVEGIKSHGHWGAMVRVRWYYRPEEAKGGRQPYHGAKELYFSDHYDTQSVQTIEGKCIVHSIENYTKLDKVRPEDFYCRFNYRVVSGEFSPNSVVVYCKCNMAYNPDNFMLQCKRCKDLFHPSCMGMTIEQAKKKEHYMCSDCVKENGAKRRKTSYPVPPRSDAKVDPKRQKR